MKRRSKSGWKVSSIDPGSDLIGGFPVGGGNQHPASSGASGIPNLLEALALQTGEHPDHFRASSIQIRSESTCDDEAPDFYGLDIYRCQQRFEPG